MKKNMPKICKHCDSCTKDYHSCNSYCLDVSWLYIVLFGPRRVSEYDTCKKWALHRKFCEQSR
ncbi:MAG: hypothetical protein K2I81_04920 [Alphaproteobacteria bacterium]|nr:hypothetical protein [Alphaproteobacteria bacterium]